MKKKILLLIILLIFLISTTTLVLILQYLDPFNNKLIWITMLVTTFILSLSSFFTILIYFLKKVHYRWEIFINHVFSSFRQWLLLSLFVLWLFIFKIIWVFSILTNLLLFLIIIFVELLFQNLSSD